MKKLMNYVAILLLLVGIVNYIYPLFFEFFGNNSGVVSFFLIFIGVTLLKYRKDQINDKK